jgi:hypothetical protein
MWKQGMCVLFQLVSYKYHMLCFLVISKHLKNLLSTFAYQGGEYGLK